MAGAKDSFLARLLSGKPMATGAHQPSNQVSGDASKTGFRRNLPIFPRIWYRLLNAEEEYRITDVLHLTLYISLVYI